VHHWSVLFAEATRTISLPLLRASKMRQKGVWNIFEAIDEVFVEGTVRAADLVRRAGPLRIISGWRSFYRH